MGQHENESSELTLKNSGRKRKSSYVCERKWTCVTLYLKMLISHSAYHSNTPLHSDLPICLFDLFFSSAFTMFMPSTLMMKGPNSSLNSLSHRFFICRLESYAQAHSLTGIKWRFWMLRRLNGSKISNSIGGFFSVQFLQKVLMHINLFLLYIHAHRDLF